MMRINSNIGTQNAQATEEIQSLINQAQTMSEEVENPAAEDYAGGAGAGADGSAIPSYDEFLSQLEGDLADKQIKIAEAERILAELEAFLNMEGVGSEQKALIREALINGTKIIAKMKRDHDSVAFQYDMATAYGNDMDKDGDGLTDEQEKIRGTDIYNIDTDGDGLTDFAEHMASVNGLASDGTKYDTAGNGISDYDKFHVEIADIFDELSIERPFSTKSMGGAGGSGGDPFGSDNFPSSVPGSGSDSSSTGGTDGGIPTPTGPTPGDDAIEVDLGSTDEGGEAGTESVNGMGAQTINSEADAVADGSAENDNEEVNETNGNMGTQAAGDGTDETQSEIAERLENQVNDVEETIEANLNGSETEYPPVSINADGGDILIVQDGNDLVVYSDNGEVKKKLIIKDGALRLIFIAGNANSVVMKGLSIDVRNGRTQAVGGEHKWVSGIFVDKGGVNVPINSTADESEDVEPGALWEEAPEEEAPAEETEPEPTGIDNVWIIHDTFTDADGNVIPSSVLEQTEDPYLDYEGDSQYVVETYQLKPGSSQFDINFPADYEGVLIKFIEMKEEGGDIVFYLKDSTTKTVKKIVLKDGVANWLSGGNPRGTINLADGWTSPIGEYNNAGLLTGQYFNAEEVSMDLRVVGGTGDDLIKTGEGMNNDVYGGKGNDHITSSGHIYGGDGDDFISGGAGNDVIDGGSGDDVMNGQMGDDHLIGGGGDDFGVFGGTGTFDGGTGKDSTNVARQNEAGSGIHVEDNVEYTSDEIMDATASIEDIISLVDGDEFASLTADEKQQMIDDLRDIFESENLDMIKTKIRQMVDNYGDIIEGDMLGGTSGGFDPLAGDGGLGDEEEEEPIPEDPGEGGV